MHSCNMSTKKDLSFVLSADLVCTGVTCPPLTVDAIQAPPAIPLELVVHSIQVYALQVFNMDLTS